MERTKFRPEMSPWKLDCGSSFCPPQPSGKLTVVSLIWKQLVVAETFTYMWGEGRTAQRLALRIKHTGLREKCQGKESK